MIRNFTRSGISFRYPENWKLEIEETDDGWSAYVSSPDTAFVIVVYHRDEVEPAELADIALEAMRENYPDMESESSVETLGGQPAIGHDVQFIALDLTNSCWIRAVTALAGCILIVSQCTDEEIPENGMIMREICDSVSLSDEP